MVRNDDDGLVRDLTADDAGARQRAWERLYRRHAPAVAGIAWRLLGQRQAADDVVQETFLRAMESIEGLRSRTSFRPWLFTIATNLCRRRLIREGQRVDIERKRHAPTMVEPASARLEVSEEIVRLQSALASLPDEQRMALVLSCTEGLSAAEIGKILGCREGTVWSRIYHAKRKLVSLLADSDRRESER